MLHVEMGKTTKRKAPQPISLAVVRLRHAPKLVTHSNGSSRPTARVIAPGARPLLHTALYCGAVATGGAQGHYIFVLQMYVVTLKYEFEAPTRSVTCLQT